MTTKSIRIVEAGLADIQRVEPLWRSMVEHHDRVAGKDWPVRSPGEAWELRSAQYREWLEAGDTWLLIAFPSDEPRGEPWGYAVLRLHESGPSWELGERIGEIESLVVTPEARGEGIGGSLIDAAREILRSRGIRYWAVEVVERNVDATRLYERHGFRGFYRRLLAETGEVGR